jgi:hypothetical protein
MTKTHWFRHDCRFESLDLTIKGLTESISVLHNKLNEIYRYDGDWFLEESEPIYGLAFIAMQNYINRSIKDFAENLKNKESFYKLEQTQNTNEKTRIELIIGLANYAKHKDEGTPHKGTRETLDYFNLNYKNVTYLDSSPIFQGLTLLSSDWDLFEITKNVTEWRESIWSSNK